MLSWGENKHYGFGLVKPVDGNTVISGESSAVCVHFSPINIAHFSAGDKAIAIVRDDGKVSLVRRQRVQDGKITTGKPKKVECNDVRTVCCGDNSLLMLCTEGKVYSVNLNESIVPRPVDNLQNRKVIQVACGEQHSIALTLEGLVFTWGHNSSGQLGLGKGESAIIRSPEPVKSLSGVPLAQIAAGGHHSFALSLSGTVFGWGRNNAGQLGVGDKTDRKSPVSVDCLNLKKTTSISCGESHSAILTKGGLVFTFGRGSHGQLGHNSLRDELRPRLVAELWGTEVTQIACGRCHTLAFVGSSQKIYSFGCGEQGQLGNGVRTVQSVPLPVQLPTDDQRILSNIFASGNHSIALCTTQEFKKDMNNPVATNKMIKTLDRDTIEMWISMSQNDKSWKKVKRDISDIFSSASCLNGSFLDTSRDKHYQTSVRYSGLDLASARLAFETLATEDKVLKEVENVVHNSLVPSLHGELVGAEGLRVFLLLTELLRVLHKRDGGSELTVAVAGTILSLSPDKLQLLEDLWLTTPYYYFKSAVKAFRIVSANCLEKNTDFNTLRATLGVLQILYSVNSRSPRRLLDRVFHVNVSRYIAEKEVQIMTTAPALRSVFEFDQYQRRIIQGQKFCQDISSFLVDYPCVLDTETKYDLFAKEMQLTRARYQKDMIPNTLVVGRETLLQDAFHCLRQKTHNPNLVSKVKFKEEAGEDWGAVSMEFFTLLAKKLLKMEPQILSVNEHGLAYFTQNQRNVTDEFYLLGLLCGMALYSGCILSIFLPMGLFKKVLGLTPSIDDLKEMSPIEAQSLQQLLSYDEEVVEEVGLDFGWSKGRELLPYGVTIPVTKVNRHKYVDLYIDMVFSKSVQHPFEEFQRGFLKGCPSQAWKMFHPDELMTLLHGDENFEWSELRENAKYVGYKSTDDIIRNFWIVFTEFSEENKKNFLIFLTATERLARGRLSRLRITIMPHTILPSDEQYPEAGTCFETLHLPAYSSIDILRDKLVHAITYCDVIGKR